VKPLDPRLWIALLSTTVVAWLSIDAMSRTSPGPLTAVHARIPELAGGAACSACHGGWFEDMAHACLDCHPAIREQADQGRGLHGQLGAERAANCALCHSEHHGETFQIVNRASFAQAGFADPAAFDHARIGFEMDGRHLELGCVACHLFAEDQVLPEGAQRFLGLDQGCANCHEDAHAGRMQIACADCHGQTDWQVRTARGHDRHLELAGGHAEVGCRSCHGEDSDRALERLSGRTRDGAGRACADCHASPHRSAFVERAAALADSTPARACVVCHRGEHETFTADGLSVSAAQHAGTGFRLGAPHDAVGCADCHEPGRGDFAARHPGRAPDDCRACHADPHEGQFDPAPPGAADCLRCHERTHFEPHAFGVELHAATALPLDGRHAGTDCGACHAVSATGGARRFRGTPAACASCHDDAHAGFFATGTAGAATADCARCHGTAAFSPHRDEGFDHGAEARFAIRGAHAESACEACHPRAEVADAQGRRFGRVAEHFGPFRGCVTCHRDPHAGRFDAPGLPTAVGDRTDCARCHQETSFRLLHGDFDHGRWTGYRLTGAHARAACSACHAPRFEPDRDGRTAERARGTRCDDCHADPHASQFRSRGRTDCARCHEAGLEFAAVGFDHDRDARFPLDAQHRGLACAACHQPFVHEGGKVVRYRPLPTACADCHGTNDDPLRRARRLRR
jgi:hypothetical protein